MKTDALPDTAPLGLSVTETASRAPGPWHATAEYIRDKNGGMIGEATNLWANVKTPIGDRIANAQLMAAAPELLAALRVAEATIDAPPNSRATQNARDVIDAAFAKAEGRQ